MIAELQLTNFKCFEDHLLPFRLTTIIVGQNNAGKTTIIEALRLLSTIANRFGDLSFHEQPEWLRGKIPRLARGVSPSLKGMEFNFENVFHRYSEPPAKIKATFRTGHVVEVYIGPNSEVYALVTMPNGSQVATKGDAKHTEIPQVHILPQVAPLERHEKLLGADYVRASLSSSLAPRHFRNQLRLLPDSYDTFRHLAEDTWNGLAISSFNGVGLLQGSELSLQIRDKDFVAEVGAMGHGLQMWLQTMWFLARVDKKSTVILDEPDVYMHADLQRKLIRLLKNQYYQVVVATHSVEILSEVDAESVLVIERQKSQSNFADNLPAVQRLIYRIGGIQNIQLARLYNSKRCLLVEGKDRDLLKHIQNVLFPNSTEAIGVIPHVSVGGWGGWHYGIGSSMLLKNSFGESIVTYCIFDSDYHTVAEKEERYIDAAKRGVQMHIWKKKEIENYSIVPSAILRLVTARRPLNKSAPELDMIVAKLEEIAETLKEEVEAALITDLHSNNKSDGVSVAYKVGRAYVNECWQDQEKRWSIVSGKAMISSLSAWSKEHYGVSFNSGSIMSQLKPHEVCLELKAVLTAIEQGRLFSDFPELNI